MKNNQTTKNYSKNKALQFQGNTLWLLIISGESHRSCPHSRMILSPKFVQVECIAEYRGEDDSVLSIRPRDRLVVLAPPTGVPGFIILKSIVFSFLAGVGVCQGCLPSGRLCPCRPCWPHPSRFRINSNFSNSTPLKLKFTSKYVVPKSWVLACKLWRGEFQS